MTSRVSKYEQFKIRSGVQPSTDNTETATSHYTFSDKIRFKFGFPEKIGGWESIPFDYNETISGAPRSLYSQSIFGSDYLLIGTNSDLYSLVGSRLTNISPLDTILIDIPDSLDTDYRTLSNNPINVTIGSSDIIISDTSSGKYKSGNKITLSGSVDVGGIPASEINKQHIIRSIGTDEYTITVATSATSTVSGGGSSVIVSSGLVTVNDLSHGMEENKRVKISEAISFDGITAAQINAEFIIRNVTTNTFDVYTDGTATSFVTSEGGSNTKYQKQITSGVVDESFGIGFGVGLFGVGLFGTALVSTTGRRYPRIWFFDRFANLIIATAGNQTGVYKWSGSNLVAPTLIPNAPEEVNYCFVSNNILVTFGAAGTENRIFASDQGDIEEWTASSTNKVFEDIIEGADRLTSHISVAGTNLIFTETQTYKFTFIDLPLVWSIELLDSNVGIIAPKAGVNVHGVAYWMGKDNFYMWRGGNVEIVPSATQEYSTILDYVFTNLTESQRSKIYCWYNHKEDEIQWHYPSSGGNDPDLIARYRVREKVWCPDSLNRFAAETPVNLGAYPRMIDGDGVLYNHEIGTDANGFPLRFELKSNKRFTGTNSQTISTIIPDSQQLGDISVTVDTFRYLQSNNKIGKKTYTVSPDTEKLELNQNGKIIQYTITGNELGQYWRAGLWGAELQVGSRA